MLSEKSPKKTSSENAGDVFVRRFLDFIWDASRETLSFETIFGRPWSETCLKSKRFVRDCAAKVKKKITRERSPERTVTTLSTKTTILEHARESSGFHGNGGSNCGADPP